MDDKLNLFKESAVEMGYPQEEVDNFLNQVEGIQDDPQIQEALQKRSYRGEAPESTTQDLSSFGGFSQEGIMPNKFPITQKFGNRSSVEIFSGGVNYGTDFGVPKNTPIALPPGKWKVKHAFGGAREGVRGTNRGYGNSVYAENMKTGEKIRLSHLSKVGVNPGDEIEGGSVIAFSGNTGNSTGPHLDVEYYDQSGRIKDILSSPYGGYF